MFHLLTEIAEGVWVYDQPLRLTGILIGHRVTVIRLPDGGLWVHSPTKLTVPFKSDLDSLGAVKHIVAPCCFHDLYLEQYNNEYPSALLYGAPGLAERHPRVNFDSVLSSEPPLNWGGVIDQTFIAGMPRQNEYAFLHKPSRALIIADLVFNIHFRKRLIDRLFFKAYRLYGKLGTSILYRFLIKDREAFIASIQSLLDWDFERIIVGHGDIVETEAKEKLRASLAATFGL